MYLNIYVFTNFFKMNTCIFPFSAIIVNSICLNSEHTVIYFIRKDTCFSVLVYGVSGNSNVGLIYLVDVDAVFGILRYREVVGNSERAVVDVVDIDAAPFVIKTISGNGVADNVCRNLVNLNAADCWDRNPNHAVPRYGVVLNDERRELVIGAVRDRFREVHARVLVISNRIAFNEKVVNAGDEQAHAR